MVTRRGKSTEKPVEEKVEEEGLLEVDLEIRDDPKQAGESEIPLVINKEKSKEPK